MSGAISEKQQVTALAEQRPAPAAAVAPYWVSGTGAINYSVTMYDAGDGSATLSWLQQDQYGTFCCGEADWVGVFLNTNQALSNPAKNTRTGMHLCSGGPAFDTGLALEPDMVAAYVILNAAKEYETVAVTATWPPQPATR
jgi:hypothetical protein